MKQLVKKNCLNESVIGHTEYIKTYGAAFRKFDGCKQWSPCVLQPVFAHQCSQYRKVIACTPTYNRTNIFTCTVGDEKVAGSSYLGDYKYGFRDQHDCTSANHGNQAGSCGLPVLR